MTSQDKSVPQRESLWAIEARYKDGTDKATLQTLVKAFKGIQKLPPDDPRSFFRISGFHGIPFRGPGVTDGKNWWGGYCHHGDVLFPSWHRAYVLRLENALRSIPGAENLRLPYWDELIGYEKPKPLATRRRLGIPPARVPPKTVPTILTSPEFENEPNPLYSYTLQEAFVYKVEGGNQRYSKPVGYETRRYPLAGLVGTKEDEKATKIHNDLYSDQAKNVTILNQNVANWLEGLVDIPDDDVNTPKPSDVTSVYERILKAIIAPNYTVFSNTTTQSGYNNTKPSKLAVSLESPHNSIHLSVGGFYQKGKEDGYNADPIRGANGEMGNNETAAFDPIFYFHHCFVDYLFWKWQELHHSTTKLEFEDTWGGTKSNIGLPVPDGAPPQPKGTQLTPETPLYPFLKDGETYFTTNDLVDIKKAGYDYGPGRLDAIIGDLPRDIPQHFSLGFSSSEVPSVQEISGINSADYEGSYVVRLYGYAKDKEGKSVKVEVGREAVLSRLKLSDCPNCESNAEKRFHIPLHQELIDLNILEREEGEGEGRNYRTSVGIHTHEGELFPENLSHLPTPVVAPL